MNESFCFILFLLLGPTLIMTQTDITLLNCPSSYLTSTLKQQSSLADWGSFLYAGFQSSSTKATIQEIVINGNTQLLSTYMNELLIPYIITGIVFLIIMSIVISWCLFSRSCPPWQWTKRDPLIHPYTKKQMKYTLFWLLLGSVGLILVSVIMLSQIPNLKLNMEKTKCSMYVSLDTALNGVSNSAWGGLTALQNSIGNISSLISSTNTQIGLYFTGDDWLKDDMIVMRATNLGIYEENKNAQLITPNPFTTATALSGGFTVPVVDSVFIKTGMGPNGTANTLVTEIDQSLRVTKQLSDQGYIITQSASQFQDSSDTIKNNFILAQNTFLMYIHQLNVFNQYLDLFSQQYLTDSFTMLLLMIQVTLALILIASLLILIASFATSIFSILQCRKMIHIGWVILMFAFFGVLLLLYLFVSLGSVSNGFCQYYHGFMTGQQVFSEIKKSNSQNILNRVDVCLFGNGNMLQKFDIASQVSTLESLFVNINTYFDQLNVSKTAEFVNQSVSIDTISKWIEIIDNYKKGIYVDSNPLQTNEDNPLYSLNQMNGYTNTGSGVATCSKDVWVFDSTNCTNSSQITYATSTQANGALLTTSDVLCISFNEGYATSYNRIWSQSDFIKRYVQIRQNCPSAYDSIISFGSSLINHRDSRINLFQGIQDTLNQLYTLNNNFISLLANFQSRATQFYNSVTTIKNLVTSQSSGILYKKNCTQFGQKIKNTYTIYCRNTMGQVVKLGICSIALILLIILAIWTGSLFAVRYSQIQKNERLNMPEENQISQRRISQKQSEDSD